jgi:hypothetical protein
VQRPNSIQSSIAVGNFAVKRSDPRWFELTLANTIYGGAFNSRIVRNIREEKGLHYSPQSVLTGFSDAGFYRSPPTSATRSPARRSPRCSRRSTRCAPRAATAPSCRAPSPTCAHLPDPDVDPDRTVGDAEQRLRVRPAEGLSGDVQGQGRGADAAQVKSGATTLLGIENSVIAIVGDWAKVKDQLAAYKDITFLDTDGKKIAAPQ